MTFRNSLLPLAAFTLFSCADDGNFVQFDTPPAVTIAEPLEGQVFDVGDTIIFRGLVSDNGGVANLEIQWASSIDAILLDTDLPDPNGAVELATASLSTGTHIVTLRAFDESANQGEARVNIVVEGVPESPSIEIEHPLAGETGLEGTPYTFIARVEDAQDAESDLMVELSSDVAGFICDMPPTSAGVSSCPATLDFGEHILTFTVTDTDGLTNSASTVFQVVSLEDYDADRDGWTPRQMDCDDNNNTVHPGATELCDGLDNDCDPRTPIDSNTECYDDDGDNYCEAPPCVNASGGLSDCDDAAPGIYPGATEVPDLVDNDCDGVVDDGLNNFDDDGDGYCERPPCVNVAGSNSGSPRDCNDGNFNVSPAETEICGNGVDDNCNNTQNEQNAIQCTNFYVDSDNDNYGVNGARECWCEGGGDAHPFGATNPNDCLDSNANVRPNQTQYFTEHRGDGSFDYDCSGSASRNPSLDEIIGCEAGFLGLSCDTVGNGGYAGGIPQCGQAGVWANDCDSCTLILALCFGGNIALGGQLIPCDVLCPTGVSCSIDTGDVSNRRMSCR